MKKKLMLMMLVTVMVLSGCGGKGTEDVNSSIAPSEESIVMAEVEEEVVESTEEVEEVVEESETTEAIEEVVEAVEDVEIANPEEAKMEQGMEKVNLVIEAYNTIMASEDQFEKELIKTAWNLDDEWKNLNNDIFTADSKTSESNSQFYSILTNYFYNYVNNNTGYYNLKAWVEQQPNWESFNFVPESISNTNDFMMFEAFNVCPFMVTCDEVSGTELIYDDSYLVSDIKSSYIIKLKCDDYEQLVAVFDQDDNLINICSPDDFEYVDPAF